MKDIFYLCVEGNVNKTYEYLNGLRGTTTEQADIKKKYFNRVIMETQIIKSLIKMENT